MLATTWAHGKHSISRRWSLAVFFQIPSYVPCSALRKKPEVSSVPYEAVFRSQTFPTQLHLVTGSPTLRSTRAGKNRALSLTKHWSTWSMRLAAPERGKSSGNPVFGLRKGKGTQVNGTFCPRGEELGLAKRPHLQQVSRGWEQSKRLWVCR